MTPTLVSLLPSDLARTRGGGERYAFELHSALTRELPGWKTRGLIAATRGGERFVPDGWQPVGGPFTHMLSAGDAIGGSTALWHTLRDADVIVSHQWRTRATTALRFGTRLRPKTKLAVMDFGAGTRLGYLLGGLPLAKADVGAHLSEFESEISPIRAHRRIVIRGGIDERRFLPAPGPGPTTDFLMVGRFLPYKGQLRFLEQLPPGATARLIGPSDSTDPEYRDAVSAKAAELGVDIGYDVSDDQLVDAYRDSRYTVQVPVDPRRYNTGAAPPELLGLTMLEAMACGSVPICPSTGASAEFVKDGQSGLTYESGSAPALAAVLAQALDEPARHAALQNGALTEAARWTWSGAARDLIGALDLPSG